MTSKKAMAQQYTEISIEEMETFLKRAYHSLHPIVQGQFRGIYYYDLSLSDTVAIRVWTSIRAHSEVSRDVGESAIRIHLVSRKDSKPLQSDKAPIVKRTQNWRDNLQDRIEDCVELYDTKSEYWDNWAATRGRHGDPEKAFKQMEKAEAEEAARREDDDGSLEESDVSRAPRHLHAVGMWSKLKDGSWGVATSDPDAQEGDTLQVKAQDGRLATVALGPMVWEGYGKKYFRKVDNRRYAGTEE